MLAYIKKEAKKYNHVIMTVENNTPVLQHELDKDENYEKALKYVKTELKKILEEEKANYQKYRLNFIQQKINNLDKAIETTSIVKTKEFIKKIIKYTHSSQVYETDPEWFDFMIDEEESWIRVYENRFEVLIDSRDYPKYRLTLHMHDKLKNKYYVANKLHSNPRKWGFDFDDDKVKAPFKPSCIDYKNPNYEGVGVIEPTI